MRKNILRTGVLRKSILLLYAHPYYQNAPTIMDHVNAFKKYSTNYVWAVNTEKGFPKGLKNIDFDVIVLHYSIFGIYPFRINKRFRSYIQKSGAHKIAFFQDEMQYCQQRFSFINELDIDSIYSLLDPKFYDDVYFKYTNVRKIYHTLTGYVDNSIFEMSSNLQKDFQDRSIDVGYRARPLQFWLGKGAQEKTEIARMFVEKTKGYNLNLNIKTGELDRIYGVAWYEFLADCKAVLGVEAGTSIFDINDEVRPLVEQRIQQNPEITFLEVYNDILIKWEDNIHYRTISPRVFEAASLKVCQILFEGTYQGILEPWVHYIPLKKDFSNIEEVLATYNNIKMVKQITEKAYVDLIKSEKYTFKSFISSFDDDLDSEGICSKTDNIDSNFIYKELTKDNYLLSVFFWLRSQFHKNWPGKKALKRLLGRK